MHSIFLRINMYEGSGVLSLEDGEFACPICKTISEFVVPIVTLPSQHGPKGPKVDPNTDFAIPDDPTLMLAGMEVHSPCEEDRPSVISNVSLLML
jgi:hypothetical protein